MKHIHGNGYNVEIKKDTPREGNSVLEREDDRIIVRMRAFKDGGDDGMSFEYEKRYWFLASDVQELLSGTRVLKEEDKP